MPNRILKLQTVKKNPISFLALGNSLSYQDRNGTGTLTATGALRYQPGSGGRVNLATQPSFETGVGQASSRGSSVLAQSTVKALFGSNSLKVDLAAIADSGVNTLARGPANSATVGETWTVSFYVWSDTTRTFKCGIEEWSSVPGYLTGLYSDRVISAGQWTRISNTKTLGNSAVNRVAAMFYTTDGLGGTVYVDGVLIEKSAEASTYFDGSYPGCAWADPITGIAGTAHASPSISRAAFWVEEGTTNLCINPSAESAATGTWGPGVTVTRDTTYAYIGTAANKAVCDGAAGDQGVAFYTSAAMGTTSARTFTGSAFVRGSGQMRVRMRARYTDATDEFGSSSITITLTDAWQRLITPAFTTNAAKTLDFLSLIVTTQTGVATTLYADNGQIEEKAYATSYCDGSLGTGYSWSGTAHASSSSRAGTVISAPNANHISTIQSSIAALVEYPNLDASASGRLLFVGNTSSPGTVGDTIYVDTGKTNLTGNFKVNGATTQTISQSALTAPAWHLVAVGWTSALISASVDAGAGTSAVRTTAPTGIIDGVNMMIGAHSSAFNLANRKLGPVAIFDRPLTQAELTLLQATDPRYWWDLLGP